MKLVLEVEQLLLLAFEQFRDRNAGPARDNAGDIVFVDLFLRQAPALRMRESPFLFAQLFLQLGERAVFQFGDSVEIVLTLGLFDLHLRLLDLLAQGPQLHRRALLRIPLHAQPRLIFAQFGELLFKLLQAPAARGVVFFAQRLALDLELHHAARDLVELLRHRIDLGAQFRGGLVDQIDGFVGEKAIGDVAAAHRGGRNQRRILDAHAVMRLVLLF